MRLACFPLCDHMGPVVQR